MDLCLWLMEGFGGSELFTLGDNYRGGSAWRVCRKGGGIVVANVVINRATVYILPFANRRVRGSFTVLREATNHPTNVSESHDRARIGGAIFRHHHGFRRPWRLIRGKCQINKKCPLKIWRGGHLAAR